MKYSIVIPCYNEEENLPKLVNSLIELSQGKDVEFLLVENGSKDNSYELMKKLTNEIPYIRIIKVDNNRGLGYGIQQGILNSKGEYIGWFHADMQTPISDIEPFFSIINNDNEKRIMVKATRHNRSFGDYFFTNGMALFCSMLFGRFLYDIQAVPVLVHKSLFQCFDEMPNGFAFDMFIYLMARKNGFLVKRSPVNIYKREKGNSSWNTGLKARIRLSRYMMRSALSISRGKYNV